MALAFPGTVSVNFASPVTLVSFKLQGSDFASTPGVGVASASFTAVFTSADVGGDGVVSLEAVVDKGGGCQQTVTGSRAYYDGGGGGGPS